MYHISLGGKLHPPTILTRDGMMSTDLNYIEMNM